MARVDVIRVKGPARLAGDVSVGGAKNSALKLMAVALLAEGRSVVENVPRITDIAIMAEVLRRLGCEVDLTDGVASIDVPAEPGSEADYDLVRRLRASICVLGPLLARRGYVRVALPGGDMIGSRGLDMHVGSQLFNLVPALAAVDVHLGPSDQGPTIDYRTRWYAPD